VTSNFSTIVDNRLHWADNIGTTESYTLYYEPQTRCRTDGQEH
jgi:hypothetical protein